MIFIKLEPIAFGVDSIMGYSQYVNQLIKKYTQNVFEAYQQTVLVMEYPDKLQVRLDDEVSRYADDELSFYSFEEKIDPSYYYIGLNSRNEKGALRINDILSDIRRHEGYRGRVFGYRIAGIISDEPQCMPCLKKKLEGLKNNESRI